MNIQQSLQQAATLLAETSPSAMLDAQVLLGHILNCNTAYLAAWPEKDLDAKQNTSYQKIIQQRLQGTPVPHLTGSREFWSLDFLTDNSTLIPRPETETLIEFTLEQFATEKNLKLLDMGTGTGAIALSIAKEKPSWKILACDISKQALDLAAQNKKNQNSDITLIQSNWFSDIKESNFDIIISNPPYICDGDPHLSQGDVRFEPSSALIAGKTGMDDIKHLCQNAKKHLAKNGWLIIEHGYNQKQQVTECFIENNYDEIKQKKDMSGHVRMTAGKAKL